MARKTSKPNHLLFLSALTFILVSTAALSISKLQSPSREITIIDKDNLPVFHPAPLPVLANEMRGGEPAFSASSIIALDIDSGVSLFAKDPDVELFPASTTKIVTALVVLDSYPMEEIITVKKINVVGQKMGLIEGEELTVRDLLKGLLIYSANDAAEVLADHYPGGRAIFVDAMNRKAQELAMTHSHFKNPSGLEDPEHISTARDMARAGAEAMNNSLFSQIVATKSTTVESVNGVKTHKLTNINKLIGTVDGVLGVKTGWTEHAKENLITYVERNGKRVVISLLASDDRFGETKTLIDWIYQSYQWEEVVLP